MKKTEQRNAEIKLLYAKLIRDMSTGEAMNEIVDKHYPYLQFDTIRSIIYTKLKQMKKKKTSFQTEASKVKIIALADLKQV